MSIILLNGDYATEVAIPPIYPETQVVLKQRSKFTVVCMNDELLAMVNMPIMKVVRVLRTIYPKHQFEYHV